MTRFSLEALPLQTVFCIFLALSGIALLYQSGDGTTLNLIGVSLVIASALSYAIYIVGVNRPILKDVATLKVTFYILLFGLSLFLIRVDFGQSLQIVDKWYLWGNLLALAVFPTAILGALEPVTAVFFGVTIFGETLTPRLGCGIILIILAVTFIIAGSNITTYLVRFRKLFPRLPIKKRGH